MRDFNFFSVYSEKTNSLLSRALLIFVCVTLVGTLIGGSYFLLYLNLEGVNAQIDEIDEFLNSRTILERQVELNGLKSRLGLINQYISLTDAIRANLDKSDYFRVSVLAALAGALPERAALSSLSGSAETLYLSFEVDSLDTSAKLLYALEGLDCFESVTPQDVKFNEKTGVYDYYLTAVMIGGADK
jgi:Tfp pilus assembly protein PilN